jgi:hypothetical protein
MKINEPMKINLLAIMVLLLVLTGYTLIFSDIWVNAKDSVAVGSHYQKFQIQAEKQTYPNGQGRQLNQPEMNGTSEQLE